MGDDDKEFLKGTGIIIVGALICIFVPHMGLALLGVPLIGYGIYKVV
jgi:hypothetical protein